MQEQAQMNAADEIAAISSVEAKWQNQCTLDFESLKNTEDFQVSPNYYAIKVWRVRRKMQTLSWGPTQKDDVKMEPADADEAKESLEACCTEDLVHQYHAQ